MKKLLLILITIGFAFTAKSQSTTYKSFKVDVQFGYAIPSAGGGGTKAGATFTLQPHYRVTDDFAAGLRIEGAALGYQTGTNTTSISALYSYCATGEYYLMDSGFRPFLGAGAGMFTQASITVGSGSSAAVSPSTSKFGFFPEAGVEAGHFRLSADYNILGSNSGYLAFKIGFFLGGGTK